MNESNEKLTLNNYLPSQVEQKWQKQWDSLRAFSPNPSDKGDPFCICLLYTSPSPRDRTRSRMPSSA